MMILFVAIIICVVLLKLEFNEAFLPPAYAPPTSNLLAFASSNHKYVKEQKGSYCYHHHPHHDGRYSGNKNNNNPAIIIPRQSSFLLLHESKSHQPTKKRSKRIILTVEKIKNVFSISFFRRGYLFSLSSTVIKLIRRVLWPNISENKVLVVENDNDNIQYGDNGSSNTTLLTHPLPIMTKSLGCPLLGHNILAGSKVNGPEYFYSRASFKLGHPPVWRYYFMGKEVYSVSGGTHVTEILQSPKFTNVAFDSWSDGMRHQEENKNKNEYQIKYGDNHNNDRVHLLSLSPKKKTAPSTTTLYSSKSVMFTADKKRHQYLRGLIGKAFTTHAIEKGMDQIVQAAEQQIISSIKNTIVSKPPPPPPTTTTTRKKISKTNDSKHIINMEGVCDKYASDIAWRYVLGLDLEETQISTGAKEYHHGKEIQRFHRAVNTYVSGALSIFAYVNIPFKILLSPPHRARKYLVSKIEERISHLEEHGPDQSILSSMVFSSDNYNDNGNSEMNKRKSSNNGNSTALEFQNTKSLSHEDVVENALILLVAGTETTSSTLTSAMYFLSLHPHIYVKLVQEQKNVINSLGSNNQEINMAFLDKCTYLDAVIRETMRIVPVSGANLRTNKDNDVILDGKLIPKGSNVFCNIRLTHELDPKIVSMENTTPTTSSMDPLLEFKPERWLNEDTKPTDDYLPFGYGPRRCLGAALAMVEMKVFLSVMTRQLETLDLVGVDIGVQNSFNVSGQLSYNMYSERFKQKKILWKPYTIIPKPLDGVPIKVSSNRRTKNM